METLTIGAAHVEACGLIHIADDQQFFSRNGLAVTFKEYDTGQATVDSMVAGEVDIAVSNEFAVVGLALRNEDVRVIASIGKSLAWHVVGRKDRGLETIADLKGKRIGLTSRGIGAFFLNRFLVLNGLSIRDVSLVDLPSSQWAEAIAGGSIDAVVAWRLFLPPIQERLGSETVVWPAQSNQPVYSVLSGRNDRIGANPDLVVRVLKSLDQAEQFLVNHPQEAQAIVSKRLRSDAADLESIWPEHQFSLSLDRSLIIAMMDEARWLIDNRLTDAKTVPDFRGVIYADGLLAVRPEAVNICPSE